MTDSDISAFDPMNQPDYKEQAALNVSLSNRANQQDTIVASYMDRARRTGKPYTLFVHADNRDIHDPVDLDNVHPALLRVMANDPSRVSYFKDNLPLWTDVIKRLDEMAPRQPRLAPLPMQKPEPMPEQQSDGSFTGRVVEWIGDLWNYWDEGDYPDDEYERDYQAHMKQLGVETNEKIDKLSRANAIMNTLDRYCPTDWRKMDEDDLDRLFRAVGEEVGIRTNDLQAADLQEIGDLTKLDFSGVRLRELTNFLGVQDIFDAATGLGLDEEAVANADEKSPLGLRLARLESLQKENELLRGFSHGSELTNNLLMSVRLIGEMYALGGMSPMLEGGYAALIEKYGWKEGLKQGLKYAFKEGFPKAMLEGLKATPAYLPQAAAEAFNQNYRSIPVTLPGENGGFEVEMPDKDVTDFVQGLFSHIFTHWNEYSTEMMGALLPFDSLADFIPMGTKRAIVQKLGWRPATARLVREFSRRHMNISGYLGEMAEEEYGALNSFLYTTIAEHLPLLSGIEVKPENTPGQKLPVLWGDELRMTLESIGLQQMLFGIALGGVTNYAGTRQMFLDHARAVREKNDAPYIIEKISEIPISQTSPGETKIALDRTSGVSFVNLDSEFAGDLRFQLTEKEGLSESEKEENRKTLDQLGLTKREIDAAKKEGRDVILERNALYAIAANKNFKNAGDFVHTILENAVSQTFGRTDGELTKESFAKEEVDKYVKAIEDIENFSEEVGETINNALTNARIKAKAKIEEGANAAQTNTRLQRSLESFKHIIRAVATYLYSETKPGQKQVVADMMKKLSFHFEEDWENFSAANAMDAIRRAVDAKSREERIANAEVRVRETEEILNREMDAWNAQPEGTPMPDSVKNALSDANLAKAELAAANESAVEEGETNGGDEIADIKARIADIETRIKAFEEATGGRSAQDEEKYETLQDELFEAKMKLAELENGAGDEIRQQIVGRRGLTNLVGEEEADRRIAEAEAMEKDGDNFAKIWAKTGLQRGVDGEWRAEIPDVRFSTEDSAKFAEDLFAFMDWYGDIVNNTWQLSELVDAPELFDAYPQLRNLKVQFVNLGNSATRGMYVHHDKRIYLNENTFNSQMLNDRMERAAASSTVDDELKKEIAVNAAGMLSTLAHEIQHAIQSIEGFARGSSPEEMERDRYAINSIDGKIKKLMKNGNKIRAEHSKAGSAFRKAFEKKGYKVHENGNYTEYGNALFETEDAVALLKKLKKGNAKVNQEIIKALEALIKASKKMDEFHEESKKIQEDYLGCYKRVAGEVESRNVQERMRRNFLERLGIPLSETEDTPRDEQIVLHQILRPEAIEQVKDKKKWAPVYEAYQLAQKMESEGVPPIVIKQVTGWERTDYGGESEWAYSIPDNYKPTQALIDFLKGDSHGKKIVFQDAFETTRELRMLYSVFPGLKRTTIRTDYLPDGDIAAWDRANHFFMMSKELANAPDLIPSVIAHEVQHYTQGFKYNFHDTSSSWEDRPWEKEAIDAAYRGTLSGDAETSLIMSTSKEAFDALRQVQREFRNVSPDTARRYLSKRWESFVEKNFERTDNIRSEDYLYDLKRFLTDDLGEKTSREEIKDTLAFVNELYGFLNKNIEEVKAEYDSTRKGYRPHKIFNALVEMWDEHRQKNALPDINREYLDAFSNADARKAYAYALTYAKYTGSIIPGERIDNNEAKDDAYYAIKTSDIVDVGFAADEKTLKKLFKNASDAGYVGAKYTLKYFDEEGTQRRKNAIHIFDSDNIKEFVPTEFDSDGNAIPLPDRFGKEIRKFAADENLVREISDASQPLFQLNGQGPRGAFYASNMKTFEDSHAALITLFQNANESTLPHESAHWLLMAMRALVDMGYGSEKMESDLKAIDAWLAKQDYSEKGAQKIAGGNAFMRDKDGNLLKDKDGNAIIREDVVRDEYFARAFERYLREGVFPESAPRGLKSALRGLWKMFIGIYREARELGAELDPSIVKFFDGIFTVNNVERSSSTLTDILREINASMLSMSKEEFAALEKSLEAAKDDAESERYLAALQAYRKGLSEQKRGWREEARILYDLSRAEKALNYVRAGHKLDENFLRDIMRLDEETIAELKKKRLVAKPAAARTTETADEAATPDAGAETQTVSVKNTEDFESAAEDAEIVLPEDEDVLAVLVYGPIWDRIKGGIVKKINEAKTSDNVRLDAENTIRDVLWKLYNDAKDSSEVYTKENLLRHLYTVGYHAVIDAIRAEKRRAGITDSGDETDQETDMPLWESIADKKGSDEELEMTRRDIASVIEKYLSGLSGTKKAVAEVVVKMIDLGNGVEIDQIKRAAAYEEFKKAGGELSLDNFGKYLKEVKSDFAILARRQEDTGSGEIEIPADILATMNELGYDSAFVLVNDLIKAKGRGAFIQDYMDWKESEYNKAFLNSPEWASESGAMLYLDALLSAMKITQGEKYSERVRIARRKALEDLMEKPVGDILAEAKSIEKSMRTSAYKIIKALKSGKEDKESAITAALNTHANVARLQAARELRADIERTYKAARRMGKAKAGSTIDGDALNALKAILRHFGLSSAKPDWTGNPNAPQTPAEAIREIVSRKYENMEDDAKRAEAIKDEYEGAMDAWSDEIKESLTDPADGDGIDVKKFTDLSYAEFKELEDLLKFIYGYSRDLMAEVKGSWANERATRLKAILDGLDANATGKYTLTEDGAWSGIKALARTGNYSMKNLTFISHAFDGNSEFYGEHKIGAFRRDFELMLARGASLELFWYQKVSKEIREHLDTLMKSCHKRKLTAHINNKHTLDFGYKESQVSGKTMAFVLLNAGDVMNRQRLMDMFGWSENELNDVLRRFTQEDFKHAEAIWAALNEMGNEMAKVFFRERHYRMSWSQNAPIELTLNDGTKIVSEGGYYPIAYKYRTSNTETDFDIANPPTRSNRAQRASATNARKTEVLNSVLRLDASVLEKAVAENARYIGMWEPLRMANAIWSDNAFKESVIRNFSNEAYQTFRKLMDNVNNPDKTSCKWVNKLTSIMATAALGFKATTMAKQYASLTVGIDRLGEGVFLDSLQAFMQNPRAFRRMVGNLSPFIRGRYNLLDRDLKVVDTKFKGNFAKTVDMYRYLAFWGLKQNDMNVATVQWWAAYNYGLAKQHLSEKDAAAYADDFVATSQGAARTIDIPEIQLNEFGRLITPFFGPACAAANTRIAGLSAMTKGKMSPGEAAEFMFDNFIFPSVAIAAIGAVANGLLNMDDDDDDDEERVRRAFFRSLFSEPISGIPLLQDVADFAASSIMDGKVPSGRDVLDIAAIRPFNEIVTNLAKSAEATKDQNYLYALYLGASAASEMMNMPIVQVYEEYEKLFIRNNFWFSDEKLKQQLKERGE